LAHRLFGRAAKLRARPGQRARLVQTSITDLHYADVGLHVPVCCLSFVCHGRNCSSRKNNGEPPKVQIRWARC